jgi:hypothetical protein
MGLRLGLWCAAVPALVAVLATPASANHGEGGAIDRTPYLLPPGEVQVGIWGVALGLGGHPLLERMQLGTNPWLWMTYVFEVPSANVDLKYELYRDQNLALALSAGYLGVFFDDLTLQLIPVELSVAVRVSDDLTIGGGGLYTRVVARGEAALTDSLDGNAEVAISSLLGYANVEWRLSGVTALIGRATILGNQEVAAYASVQGAGEPLGPFADPEAGVAARAKLMPRELGYNASLSVAFSWSTFNLRLGVQYGHLVIPGVNVVVPEKTWAPVGDVFLRF